VAVLVGRQLQLPIFNNGKIKLNIAVNEVRVEQEKLFYGNEIQTAFEEAAIPVAELAEGSQIEGRLESTDASMSCSRLP